jgi:hypothetical protein
MIAADFLLFLSQPALGKSARIARYDFGGSHEQPTQVAAATQAAWLYFAASIKKVSRNSLFFLKHLTLAIDFD